MSPPIRPNIKARVWSPPDHTPAPRSTRHPRTITVRATDAPYRRPEPQVPHLIEKTSKPLKAQYAVFFILFLVGIVTFLGRGELLPHHNPAPIGLILTGIGFGGMILAKIRIWWHHG